MTRGQISWRDCWVTWDTKFESQSVAIIILTRLLFCCCFQHACNCQSVPNTRTLSTSFYQELPSHSSQYVDTLLYPIRGCLIRCHIVDAALLYPYAAVTRYQFQQWNITRKRAAEVMQSFQGMRQKKWIWFHFPCSVGISTVTECLQCIILYLHPERKLQLLHLQFTSLSCFHHYLTLDRVVK